MHAQSNVTHMFVGKGTILGATSERDDLTVGQIGIFLVGSKVAKVDALTAGQKFTVVTKNQSNVVIESPVMTFGSGVASQNQYSAPTKETKAIGYNGTSGTIADANSTEYVTHVDWKDNSKTYGQSNSLVKFAAYTSSTSANELEIADGLAVNFNKNFSREDPKILKAEILSAAAGAAMTGTGTLTVKNGSKYATAGTAVEAVAVVGDYIRIGGTTTAFPAYKVVALDTTNDIVTFDMPYQGDSATVAEASTEVITAAAGAAASAGVKITAVDDQKYFDPGLVKNSTAVFDIQLNEGFGATDLTNLIAGDPGLGSYYEVSEKEWFLKGNRGETWRQGNYPKPTKLEADSTLTYDFTTIEFAEANSQTIDRSVMAFGDVIIATKKDDGIYASLTTVLAL